MPTVIRFARSGAGWLVVVAVFVLLIGVGATREQGPRTQEDRVDAITSQVACPICDGESVFESRNAASRAIRNEVTDLVRANELTDAEILARIENTYGSEVMLVPDRSGIGAVAWTAPIIVTVLGIVGLGAAFMRWRRTQSPQTPTAGDRRLVASALEDEQ